MFIGCECRDLMKIQMSFRSLKRLFTSSPTAEEYLTFAGESRNAPYFDYTKNDDGALRRLATAVEVLATRQESMADSVGRLDEKLDALERRPAKRWESLTDKLLLALAGAFVSFLLTRGGGL